MMGDTYHDRGTEPELELELELELAYVAVDTYNRTTG
jgi:hypothetical protein